MSYLFDNCRCRGAVNRTPKDDFGMEMIDEEVYQELYAAIRTLPEECQLIFYLKLGGKNCREIAVELEITEKNVIDIQRYGWELLHKKLSGFMALVVSRYFFVEK